MCLKESRHTGMLLCHHRISCGDYVVHVLTPRKKIIKNKTAPQLIYFFVITFFPKPLTFWLPCCYKRKMWELFPRLFTWLKNYWILWRCCTMYSMPSKCPLTIDPRHKTKDSAAEKLESCPKSPCKWYILEKDICWSDSRVQIFK